MKDLFVLLLLSFFLISCETGYVKTDGEWTYVIINEGGKTIIEMDADMASFEILDQKAYAIDKNTVFHRGYPLEGMDPATIEFFDHPLYLKDVNGVYFQSTKIPFAKPESFQLLKFPYAKDDQWLYNGTVPFQVDSINQFKVTSGDETRTYYTLKFFIQQYPSYQWLDTTDTKNLIIIENATGETLHESYQGILKND